ncbi:hypothetical protein M1437_04135, partial [Patescibacteria group bacterium]|nr:hypothetical protein [Patescibacteria group bacterium]
CQAEINSEALADGFSPLTAERWREFLYVVGDRHPKTLHYQLLQENGYLRELEQFTIRKP